MSSAVDRAITDMPDSFVIKSFLELHRTEVKGMLLTEYNEIETMKRFERDGERKGEMKLATLITKLFSLVHRFLNTCADTCPLSRIAQAKKPRRCPHRPRFLTCTLEKAFCVYTQVFCERCTRTRG